MISAVVLVILAGSPQTPAPSVAVSGLPEKPISELARGWTALAAGRAGEAERIADGILARDPSNHEGAALKIQTRALAAPLQALDTYEAWLGRRKDEDLGLLEIVADGVLRELAARGDTSIREEARRQLTRMRSVPAGLPAGELQRLQRSAADPAVSDKTAVAESLAHGGAAAVPALVELLKAAQGPNRAAAARALGAIGDARAEAALLDASRDQDSFVRGSAAVALARLGNAAGQEQVNAMLASDLPDYRLMAAEAWNGRPGVWVEAVRPLLDNENPLTRIRAAAALAPIDPTVANRVLAAALDDENPAIRAESARTLSRVAAERPEAADLAALRKQLRDPDTWIRVSAAGAIRAAAVARP